ncbi:MAG: hypothetical protein AAB657_01800, partial [Patescibacteria group bacterium]
MVILMMIASVNFFPIKQKTSLSTAVQSLITDIKEQQLKAMSGETTQGVYFDGDKRKYTVFKGTTYEASNTTNFTVPLGDQIIASEINFSGSQLIFAPGSGEISNFLPGNKIVLLNTVSNEQKTIFFNKYGTIINIE